MESLEMLDVSNNKCVGSLPTELGLLKTLQVLKASTNLLTGPIPSELGELNSILGILELGM
jgi:Leucine-rich repeat (LRR) protein